jgi:hypothetical protein
MLAGTGALHNRRRFACPSLKPAERSQLLLYGLDWGVS